jgi:dipeptidyl aminopeptidase/acylaminoacyl peptidase
LGPHRPSKGKGVNVPQLNVQFSDDGSRLAATGPAPDGGGVGKVWDMGAPRELLAFQVRYLWMRWQLSPDGRRLVTADGDPLQEKTPADQLRLWDVDRGREIVARPGTIDYLVFSPDSKHFAGTLLPESKRLPRFFLPGTRALVWDADTGAERAELEKPADNVGYGTLVFSPDGTRLASFATAYPQPQGEVGIYAVATGKELLRLKGHASPVSTVAFSLDGKRLATAALGPRGPQQVILWDAATGYELVRWKVEGGNFPGGPSGPSLSFSRNDTRLTLASENPGGRFGPQLEPVVWDATPRPEK